MKITASSGRKRLLLHVCARLILLTLPVLSSTAARAQSHELITVQPFLSEDSEPLAPPVIKLEQMRPQEPRVSLVDGQLTIEAKNCTLGGILARVKEQTGAQFLDLPPGVNEERIVGHFGPGPAREVLGNLLLATSFDFVIRSSEEDTVGIQAVLLVKRNLAPRMSLAAAGSTEAKPARARRRPTTAMSTASDTKVSETTSTPEIAKVDPEPVGQSTPANLPIVLPPPGTEPPANGRKVDSRATRELVQAMQALYQAELKRLQPK